MANDELLIARVKKISHDPTHFCDNEHGNLLGQGVEVWNQWRQQHPNVRPNFRGADLSNIHVSDIDPVLEKNAKPPVSITKLINPALIAQLQNADFNDANFRGASFDGANLSNANLLSASLIEVSFWRADLSNANLSGDRCMSANFSSANLSGANLSGANLDGAHFLSTNLSNADLSNANLSNATLSQADLSNANLSGTNLVDTDLYAAKLRNTNFTQAVVAWTKFTALDLSSAEGLHTIMHEGPSIIDLRTIDLSRGLIPTSFLRGAGASDILIEYICSLTSKPIDFYTCFISYSHKDQVFAERLYADLQSKGVRCWFAPEDLKIGDHYHQRIDESIRMYDKLILVLSEHAIQSAWVEREVVAAREKEDRMQRPVLFPLRIDDAVIDTSKAWAADVRRRWHIGDFTQWKHHDAYQQAFERLLRDLKSGENS